MSRAMDGSEGVAQELSAEYERPAVVPVGNLHDLLLGSSGSLCDATTDQPDDRTGGGTGCI